MNARRLNLACTMSMVLSLASAGAAGAAPAAGRIMAGLGHPLYLGDLRTSSIVTQSATDGRVTGQPQLDSRGLPGEPTLPIGCSAALAGIDSAKDGGALADRVTPLLARRGRPFGSVDAQPMLDAGIEFSVRLHQFRGLLMSSVVANRTSAPPRAGTNCSALRTARLALFLFAALAFGQRPVAAQDATGALPAGSRILIQSSDGEFIDAKLGEARPDSILVRKGKRTIAIPVGDVQGAWTWKHDPIGGLKAGAAYGALVGVLSGVTVPGDCIYCEEARGSSDVVLRRTLASAGLFGFLGLISGQFDGAWRNHPGFAGTRATPPRGPFPLWSLSGSIGRTYNLNRSETPTSTALAG